MEMGMESVEAVGDLEAEGRREGKEQLISGELVSRHQLIQYFHKNF